MFPRIRNQPVLTTVFLLHPTELKKCNLLGIWYAITCIFDLLDDRWIWRLQKKCLIWGKIAYLIVDIWQWIAQGIRHIFLWEAIKKKNPFSDIWKLLNCMKNFDSLQDQTLIQPSLRSSSIWEYQENCAVHSLWHKRNICS